MKILIHWLVSALAIIITAYILPGVYVHGFWTALVLAVVLGAINVTLRPVLILLTLPLSILTLGLFALVINGLLVLLTTKIVPGFIVTNLGWAIIFGMVLSVVNWILKRFE